MIEKIKIISLMLFISILFTSCGHPTITPKMIEQDIVGRKMGGFWDGWTFAKEEPRTIKILKAGYSKENATIIVHISTRNGGPSGEKYSGKIRLKYDWISPGWDLVKIENINFGKE